MNEIAIRLAGLDEMPRIAHLKQQIHDVHVQGRPDLFAPFSGMDALMEHAAAKNCELLLAECADTVVGYVMLQYVNRPAGPYMNARCFVHVEEFCVDNSRHRQGIGRKLMDALRQLAHEKGYPRIELDVWNFNEGARQFYESCGMHAYRTFLEMDV